MTAVVCALGIFILLLSMGCIFFNPQYSIIGLVVLLQVDFCFKEYVPQDSYQALLKFLILVSEILLLLKHRKGIHRGVIVINIVLLIISLILYRKYSLPNFSVNDIMTSFTTTVLGFFLMYVPWDKETRILALKALSISAIVSALLGILVRGYVFTSANKFPGLDSPASLVIVAAVGMIASYILTVVYNQKKYFSVGIINFVICGLCNMRGGLLFAVIAILGMAMSYFKRIPKKLFRKLLLLSPIFIVIFIFIGGRILLRMRDLSYSVGAVEGMMNTSNRIFAWNEILAATKTHRILGWGIGYTKKIDGIWLNYGFRAVHNEYIRWIVESGYVGLIGIITCFVFVFSFLSKNNIGVYNSVIVFLFIAFAVFSFTDNTMYGSVGWITFSMLISVLGDNIGKTGNSISVNGRKVSVKL